LISGCGRIGDGKDIINQIVRQSSYLGNGKITLIS